MCVCVNALFKEILKFVSRLCKRINLIFEARLFLGTLAGTGKGKSGSHQLYLQWSPVGCWHAPMSVVVYSQISFISEALEKWMVTSFVLLSATRWGNDWTCAASSKSSMLLVCSSYFSFFNTICPIKYFQIFFLNKYLFVFVIGLLYLKNSMISSFN